MNYLKYGNKSGANQLSHTHTHTHTHTHFAYLISLRRCGGADTPNLDQCQVKLLAGGEHWAEVGGALGLGLAVTMAKVARQPQTKEVHLTTHTLQRIGEERGKSFFKARHLHVCGSALASYPGRHFPLLSRPGYEAGFAFALLGDRCA